MDMLRREENNLNRYYHALLYEEDNIPSLLDSSPYGDLSDMATEMYEARVKGGVAGLKRYIAALSKIKDVVMVIPETSSRLLDARNQQAGTCTEGVEPSDISAHREMVIILRPSFMKFCQDGCRAAVFNHILYWIARKGRGQPMVVPFVQTKMDQF